MPFQLTLDANYKKLLAYVTLVATSSILIVSSAKATDWTVTVVATGTAPTLTYKIDPDPTQYPNCAGSAPFGAPSKTADYIYVCGGDTIKWIADTKSNGAGKKKSQMSVVLDDEVLFDSDTKRALVFHAVDGNQTGVGMTDSASLPDVPHEYYVTVFDKVTKQWHVADPKIIIGHGGPIPVETVENECEKLAKSRGEKEFCEQLVTDLKKLAHK